MKKLTTTLLRAATTAAVSYGAGKLFDKIVGHFCK